MFFVSFIIKHLHRVSNFWITTAATFWITTAAVQTADFIY